MNRHDAKSLATVAVVLIGLLMTTTVKAGLVPGCPSSDCSICSPSENSRQASPVPGTSTVIAGVLLLLPFGFSTARILCRRKSPAALE